MTPPTEAATYWRALHEPQPAAGWCVDVLIEHRDEARYVLTGASPGRARAYLAQMGAALASQGRVAIRADADHETRCVVVRIGAMDPRGTHPLSWALVLDAAVPRAA